MDHLGLLDQVLTADVFGTGGGWRLQDMNPNLVAPTGTHQPNTWLDITGPGILTSINSRGSRIITLQIDGGPIYSFDVNSQRIIPMLPFKSSCVVMGNSTSDRLAYAMAVVGDPTDGKLSSMTPVSSITISQQVNTVLDITGSGVLTDLVAVTTAEHTIGIEVDNSGVWIRAASAKADHNQGAFFIPFKTRIRVTTNQAANTLAVMYDLD